MIYGKTTDEQYKSDWNIFVSKFFNLRMGEKRFAFFPVTMLDGRKLWADFYYTSIYHGYNPEEYHLNVFPNFRLNVYYEGQSNSVFSEDLKWSDKEEYMKRYGRETKVQR